MALFSRYNKRRACSVLILPSRGTELRRLVISPGALRLALGLSLAVFCLGGWAAFDYLKLKLERGRVELLTSRLLEDLGELRVRSRHQREKILSLRERLEEKMGLLAETGLKRKEAENLGIRLAEKVRLLEARHRKKVAALEAELRDHRAKLFALQGRLEGSRRLLAKVREKRGEIEASLPSRRKGLLEGDEIILELEKGIAALHWGIEGLLASLPSKWPVDGWISSGFGRRLSPWTGKSDFHGGVDIANRSGTPVLAPGDGVVRFAGRNGASGNSVVIDHGQGITTHYAHLSKIYVKKGDQVRSEQKIAAMGSTGRSTSPHLHYEVRVRDVPINPRKHLLKDSPKHP